MDFSILNISVVAINLHSVKVDVVFTPEIIKMYGLSLTEEEELYCNMFECYIYKELTKRNRLLSNR